MGNQSTGILDSDPADIEAQAADDEAGYVLPMTALLLIPLMIFAAFATDVGAWYVRADQTQQAADAAALAGTVWLPDEPQAEAVALDVAARNGFRDPAWTAVNGGTPNATVNVPPVSAGGGLRVDIITESPSFFGSVVLDDITIERRAIATVTEPVRMGNPSNGIGTGNLAVSELGVPPDGVWLSLNGYCQDHEQGDPFSVGNFGAPYSGGNRGWACSTANAGANPTYNPDGYTFIVDVPSGAGAVALEIFEPGICTDADTSDDLFSASDNWANSPRINTKVFANDGTDRYHEDNLASTPVFDYLYGIGDCTGGSGAGGRWYTMYTIPSGSASEGKWYIQTAVRNEPSESGLNNFSLRARPVADTGLCSSMTDPTCPQLYAYDWLSLYRPDFGGAASTSEFFLAEIDTVHRGKTVEVTLFDPGEGMNNIQFLDPSGNEVAFEYRRANCSVGLVCIDNTYWPEETTAGPDDDCGGIPCLDVTGAVFNDEWVVVTIDLDPTYNCGGNCWWKVRYTAQGSGAITDRTTWSTRVIGGPVRLIE